MRSPEDIPADIEAVASKICQEIPVDYHRNWFSITRDLIARALMERDRAATERVAKTANEQAETLRNQCNKSFNDGDQGSAILERTKADALDEFAAAIRSQP
jgi:hypothetical protein